MPETNDPTPDLQDAQRWQEEDASKPNSNCLRGMQCPKCLSYAPFRIEVRVLILMYDDGSDSDDMSGMGWGEDSYCECYQCQHYGTVKDFRKEIQS